MQEKGNHYSNKGGHKIRSIINKLLREKIIENKREVSLCLEMEGNITRVPDYEKE